MTGFEGPWNWDDSSLLSTFILMTKAFIVFDPHNSQTVNVYNVIVSVGFALCTCALHLSVCCRVGSRTLFGAFSSVTQHFKVLLSAPFAQNLPTTMWMTLCLMFHIHGGLLVECPESFKNNRFYIEHKWNTVCNTGSVNKSDNGAFLFLRSSFGHSELFSTSISMFPKLLEINIHFSSV